MSLPQDLSNLFALAIRDVIWYKDNVISFLLKCGVPESIMLEVRRQKKTPTIKLIQFVLQELSVKGDEGWQITQKLMTELYYWKDIHSIEPDRKDAAVKSLREFQKACQQYRAQREYQDQQKRQQEKIHVGRLSKDNIKPLDHEKLALFRDEFDRIHSISDPKQRGNEFENLMNRIFEYYCQDSKGSFIRTGEQVDGLFKLDHHWHYVEIRWKAKKASAADVSVLRDRARDSYGGDTKALFISFNGFSDDCLKRLEGKDDERVILMDGYDLRCVLDSQIAFDVLLAEKQAEIIRSKRPLVSAQEIINNLKNKAHK